MHLPLLLGGLADVHGPRRVRAVSVLEPAEVEHHHVAVLDHPVADLVVRVGAVGPGPDDGEVHLVPELPRQVGQVAHPPRSRCARRTGPDDLLVGLVGRRARRRQPLDLIGVLDRPQHRQRVVIEDVGRSRQLACRPSRCIAQAESETA